MAISAVSDIGISTYVVTRVSARKGETPPVDAVDAVDSVGSSQQGPSEEISWMEAMSLFGSSGAVVQRLSILSGRPANNPEAAEESLRRSAENAGRPRSQQRPGAEEPSENSPRPDPIRRLIDAVTERAQGLAFSQQWTSDQMAVLAEMIQQFRGDVRQADQSFDPRSAKRDDFLDHLGDAFAKFNRSLESGSGADPAADDSADIANVKDALTDSPIPPDTLRAAFAAELANLRMTLSEMDKLDPFSPRPAGENFQIEQYLAMNRDRIEQQRMDQYRPQLDAVA